MARIATGDGKPRHGFRASPRGRGSLGGSVVLLGHCLDHRHDSRLDWIGQGFPGRQDGGEGGVYGGDFFGESAKRTAKTGGRRIVTLVVAGVTRILNWTLNQRVPGSNPGRRSQKPL